MTVVLVRVGTLNITLFISGLNTPVTVVFSDRGCLQRD